MKYALKIGGGSYRGYAHNLPAVGYASEDQNLGKPFTMAGYPFDDDECGGWTMYNGSGRTHNWYSPRLFYGKRIVRTDLDANNGDSGSPLWNTERTGQDTVFAVMTMLGARGRQTGSDSEAVVLCPVSLRAR